MGEYFLQHNLYVTAKQCFDNAKNEEKSSACDAFMIVENVTASMHSMTPKVRREEYLKAADMFFKGSYYKQAARCLQNAKEPALAAKIFKEIGQVQLIRYC